MRTVFLGTPRAAVPALEALSTISDVVLVVTQPDRPRGRSGRPRPPPVKEAALSHGYHVVQPSSSAELGGLLADIGPVDVAVLVAFGMLIRVDALTVPAAGIVNVHFSLLPRWRGAAPVHRAILAGDTRTGVTLMQLDAGLDTGPIFTSASTVIGPEETAGDLTDRLATIGAAVLVRWLPAITAGTVTPVAQSDERASTAPKVAPDDRLLGPELDPATFVRSVRALTPAPGAWIRHDGGRMRIHAAAVAADADLPAGRLDTAGDRLLLGVTGGAVELRQVQPEGKRPMPGIAWARGRREGLGSVE